MTEILGYIAQYGLGPVIAAAVIYIFIRIEKHWEKKKLAKEEAENRKAEEEALAKKEKEQREAEVAREQRLIAMVKDLVQGPQHTAEEQKQNRKINEFIVKQLGCMVDDGPADRAYMFSFHNGGTDMLGRGFLKMSMTEEDVNDDIVPIMAKYQNMPRMLFPVLYEQLDENDYYNIDDVETIKKTDPCTYQFLIEHGAKSALFRSIKKEDGLMLGFVGVEYIKHQCEDGKKASRNIDQKVNRIIGALLNQNS